MNDEFTLLKSGLCSFFKEKTWLKNVYNTFGFALIKNKREGTISYIIEIRKNELDSKI